jgi:outer membrane receptor protein involved in Fe transport
MAKGMTESVRPVALLMTTLACSAGVIAQEPAEQPQDPAQAPNPNGVIDEVIAIGRLKSTALDVVAERMEQEVVSDFLGAEAISRVGDSTVSLALRRVPGLTLVNDQFIYVRGLGERYSSVLLNGAPVPSPDLTRNVIPLDIFPTAIIDALAVQKGYSPEAPAAFGGGSVDIRTRGIPNGPIVNIEIGSGYNSDGNSDGYAYPGGSDDGLGTDDGTRALPAALRAGLQRFQGNISPTRIFDNLNGDGNFHFFQEAEALNRDLATSLDRNVEIGKKSLGPDGSLEVALGNRWYVGGQELWDVGALGLVSYDNSWRNRERVERDVADPLTLVENKVRTINQVSVTAVLNLGVSYTDDHEITASSFFLRNTEDESAISTRTNNNFQRADGHQLRDYDIRYEQRELTANQVRGHHVIGRDTRATFDFLDRGALDGLTFDWYVSNATAETDIPNEIKFSAEDQIDPLTGEVLQTAIRRSNSAADYRFTFLEDEVRSSGWDLMKPLTFERVDIEISGGQDISQKARSYAQNQFGLGSTTLAATPILIGTPGQVFTDANILNPLYGFALTAGGIGTESYLAAQSNDGAYFKVDALIDERWRFAGGLRWEQFRQVSLPIDTLSYDVGQGQCALSPCDIDALQRITFFEDDVYPAFAATRIMRDVWADDFQLRFGISETVARPDLREVSGSSYIDPLTETRIRGNPNLVTSAITNFDLRAEWFFGNGDNFTASLFYKDIEKPIETVQGAGTDDNISLTFVNAQAADIRGIEVEWLKDLSSFGVRFLEPFFFSGNVTLSDSELTVGDVGYNDTNAVRPMAQHSEYVANLQLGFDSNNGAHSFTIAYNTFGERLFFAGRDGAADAYERPFDSLDFVYSYYPSDRVSVKFRIQNLLDERLEIEQSGVTVIEQNVGATAKIDVQWDLGR